MTDTETGEYVYKVLGCIRQTKGITPRIPSYFMSTKWINLGYGG